MATAPRARSAASPPGSASRPTASTCRSASLSGGQKRRVEIARILFAGSDVLLLDEPTNHLDSDAKEWLLGFMRAYKGALLVISHDLDLLDEAITRVLHLERRDETGIGEIEEYKGTYSEYLVAREKDEVRLAKLAQRQAKEIDRLQTLVDRFGAKATKASMAHSIEKRIVRLEGTKVEAPRAGRSVHVRFPPPPPPGRLVMEGTGLAVRYGDLEVFHDVDVVVERGERLLIMGLNGAGKTSLLRVLAGDRPADAGGVTLGHNVVTGYYAQEHEGIHPGRTILEHLREQVPLAAETDLRAIVGAMGLTGDKVHQDAGTLSGGEKTKLALGILVAGRHNLLLLDEPTNNLDPGSRVAVAEGLRGWPGSIVLVSHDAAFVRDLAARPRAAHARGHPRPLGRRLPRARRAGVRDAAALGPVARALHWGNRGASPRRCGSASRCRRCDSTRMRVFVSGTSTPAFGRAGSA